MHKLYLALLLSAAVLAAQAAAPAYGKTRDQCDGDWVRCQSNCANYGPKGADLLERCVRACARKAGSCFHSASSGGQNRTGAGAGTDTTPRRPVATPPTSAGTSKH